MNPERIAKIASLLIRGIPKLVDAIRKGRDPSEIKLGEFISRDAVKSISDSVTESEAFENKFQPG